MNSKPKIPCIPIDGVISYEDWLKGRRYRRQLGNRVAPEIIRRKTSSSDRRLKRPLVARILTIIKRFRIYE